MDELCEILFNQLGQWMINVAGKFGTEYPLSCKVHFSGVGTMNACLVDQNVCPSMGLYLIAFNR